ncbi:ABC transporter ATP-binding protein [Fulvivirgaceae bacterium BMA10]|uniref:ABC transporter ATP-binding protein n=1 Tax=Splendidivirga corallicola TaxID=3051826 RepID=A0ABT8KZN2_9BACT|nr:ABC transporter ATP-binding protein [Fulvivirgaceae bacterium BMA10]
MINIKNLKKSFGKNEVLKGIDLDINNNGIFAILGPNGSGKTTIIKSILGLVVPDEGDIVLQQKNIARNWKYREYVNYLPQIARFPENLKVRELIDMVKDLRNSPAHEQELIELFELNTSLDKSLKNLSGGTRQKVNVVLSFMFDNPILILDEPTVGLDPVAMIRLKKLILKERKKGKTILLTTHIMSVVEELADEIVFLLEGKIHFRGSLEELNQRAQGKNLEHSIAKILENGMEQEAQITDPVNSRQLNFQQRYA